MPANVTRYTVAMAVAKAMLAGSFVVAFGLTSTEAAAQVLVGPEVGLGLRVLRVENHVPGAVYWANPRPSVGARAEFRFSSCCAFAMNSRLVSSLSTASFDVTDSFGTFHVESDFESLSLGLEPGFKWLLAARINGPFIALRSSYSVLLFEDTRYTVSGDQITLEGSSTRNDVSVGVEIGYDAKVLANAVLSVGARYDHGMIDIQNDGHGEMRTWAFSISAGLLFGRR